MALENVRDIELLGDGVVFEYLVFVLELDANKKPILRASNYISSNVGSEEALIRRTRKDLEKIGFFKAGGNLTVHGGGSLARNPYYGTITLFGANEAYGPDRDRQALSQTVQTAFPDYEVSWFEPEP